jgi:hypothetical protein
MSATPVRSLVALALSLGISGAATLSGEFKTWHKTTFDFEGPSTSESASPNPFTDYRLNVTFTHPASGKSYLVPGYYAADGNAANSSATAGHVWRAHFAPDETGDWNYAVSFRSGGNVAVNPSPTAGTGAGFFDGESGQFTVDSTDKTGRDFRGRGRLQYVGKHHLRFAASGRYFMKAGVDSPENLLAYSDFDGDFKTDGHEDDLVRSWAPHVADWQTGDPTWQGNKGKGLIGAINYLASEGLNAFSFLTMNINGDDQNVFPYTTYGERLRMDVSRLDQWEILFEHGTRQGMHLHFKTQETENELLLDGGNTGTQRSLYYRELIARFSHHLALNWNLGEEINNASLSQKQAWAKYFHDHDPYSHPIVIHNGSSHFDMMGTASELTGFSLQMNEANFSDTFYNVERYVNRSTDFGKPWVVACDEPGNSSTSLRPDNDPGSSHVDARRDALWATIMAGGAGIEFYFGYNYPNSDLTCEDFRSRDAFWDYCRHALQLFDDENFSFELMTNHNELVSGNGDNANRCLARIGEAYLVQLRAGGSHTLDLSAAAGSYTVKWFNPRTGGPVTTASPISGGGVRSLGSPPATTTQDWIVLVQSTGGANGTNSPPVVSAGPDRTAFLSAGSGTVSVTGSVSDDGLPDAFSLTRTWSQVAGPATVSFSNNSTVATVATFTVAGNYTLRLEASDSDLSASDEVNLLISPPAGDNQPPVFGGFAAATLINRPLVLTFAELLAAASDPDGDPLTVQPWEGTTSGGGEVTMGATSLTYTPVIDLAEPDSFELTVEDGRGGSASGMIALSVVEADGIADSTMLVEWLPQSDVRVAFTGVPGLAYEVQRSLDLVGWSLLAVRRANPAGALDWIDADPPAGRAFYRIGSP